MRVVIRAQFSLPSTIALEKMPMSLLTAPIDLELSTSVDGVEVTCGSFAEAVELIEFMRAREIATRNLETKP